MLISSLFCIAVLVLGSCSGQTNSTDAISGMSYKTVDTFVRDIPDDKQVDSYKAIKEGIEKKIGINNLENGYDGLQIRLWYGYVFKNEGQLIVIKDTNSKQSAEFYSLTYLYNEKGDSIQSIKKEVSVKRPKSGWKEFTDKLFKLDILTLPDYHLLPGYYLNTDPDGITVEIATSNRYRIYAYPEPGYHKDKIIQAKKIVEIMKLIEDEFDFGRLREF